VACFESAQWSLITASRLRLRQSLYQFTAPDAFVRIVLAWLAFWQGVPAMELCRQFRSFRNAI
jgi:hypothetical protein